MSVLREGTEELAKLKHNFYLPTVQVLEVILDLDVTKDYENQRVLVLSRITHAAQDCKHSRKFYDHRLPQKAFKDVGKTHLQCSKCDNDLEFTKHPPVKQAAIKCTHCEHKIEQKLDDNESWGEENTKNFFLNTHSVPLVKRSLNDEEVSKQFAEAMGAIASSIHDSIKRI